MSDSSIFEKEDTETEKISTLEPCFLYVEDDMASREVVKVLITKVLKWEKIAIFEDSANFMERIAGLSFVPAIIFLDIQIGPHDGFALIKMLREDERFKDKTIIAMTANVMVTDVEKLRSAGFDGLIGKPIDRAIFPKLVNKVIHREAVWYVS